MPAKSLCNNGTCEDIGNSHRCHCTEGYTGSYCQDEINECDSAPCQNGATCKDLIGSYACQCTRGFQGQNCELNVDDCNPNPCQNGGTCHDFINHFSCSCPSGTLGIICEINVEDCLPGACHNNGTCTDKVGGFECRCPPGFVGPRCEGDINECLSNPCSGPGTQDCVQLINDYHCNCKPGYMGRHCEMKVNFCANSPCQNGGICTAIHADHKCTCPEGYYGKNCEFNGFDCDSDPCQNGGICRIAEGGGYRCECPRGTKGTNCEIDALNECDSNPCKQREAICQDKLGDYACYCPAEWNGKNCEIYDREFPGGLGYPIQKSRVKPHLSIDAIDLAYQKEQCIKKGCREKQADFHCDEECNTYACNFDGNDCSLGINPWRNCTAPIKCWEVFMDGKCNEVCNNPQCLFDGRDCEKKLQPCNPIYDAYCQKHYANGHCDYGCNNAECNWDGLDCEEKPPELAEGVIAVIVLMELKTFKENLVAFLRDMSHQLRTTVRVKKDELGNDMISPWVGSAGPNIRDSIFGKKHKILYTEAVKQSGVQAFLEIDNRKCTIMSGGECFPTANEAAEFLAAKASRHTLSQSFPIFQVRGESGPVLPEVEPGTNLNYVLVGVILVLLACGLLGVLVTAQRKRAAGITWFPEGFLRTSSGTRRRSRRRGPDGQEMRNLNKNPSFTGMDVDVNQHGQHIGPGQQWSDDESDLPQPKRMRVIDAGYSSDHTAITDYEETEPRVWTQTHLEAADIRVPPSMMTPPQVDGNNDIDARGPCGMTPLMVAAVRGGGVDTGEDEEEDSTAAVIADLVAQGAELNATMDKTGETSLHLAARYARADAAKRLLDAGADANSQDNTGRTPLHAAVAADARGVFQILLRNRATNLNARMHEGTTPLILAARLAIEGMVEDLINADADINAADNSGKTALHWAAAVNNVDAVNILLAHGANRDAQDDKDETPLFLAAREGSYEACKALLDTFANREITDHMDRLPRDVASERLHHDIVRLLDEHIPRSPQMANVISNGGLIGSPNNHPHQMITHPTVIGPAPKQNKSKKRPKAGNTAPQDPNSPEVEGASTVVRRKPSVKKAQTKKNQTNPQHTILPTENMNSSSLSPVESPHTNIPSPYDTASLYSNAMAMTFDGMLSSKQPPSYEDCIKNAQQSIQVNLSNINLDNYAGYTLPAFHEQLLMQQRQMQPNTLSPPYSNQSPPHSVQSSVSMSPQAFTGSPSPAKNRPSLPTSPTHIAAMRAATHQKHGGIPQTQNLPMGFDFTQVGLEIPLAYSVTQASSGLTPPLSLQPQQYQQNYQYLTPPSQHSGGADATPQHMLQVPDNFPTPSPESPGHWSSSSPHSCNSDWSENITSPNAYVSGTHQNKGSEAIYI